MNDPVTSRELIDATRQLAMLARLKLPMTKAFEQMGDRPRWLGAVAEDLAAGSTLTVAVARHPRVFSPFYAGMVSAAGASGKPEQILDTLSQWLERGWRVRRRMRTLLLYPFLVLNIMFLQLIFFSAIIIPQVLLPLGAMDSEPGQSMTIASLQATFSSQLPTIVIVVLMMLLNVTLLLPWLRRGTISLLPPVRNLNELCDQALWARGVGSLLAADVPLPQALEQTASIMTAAALRREVTTLAERVRRGDQLSQALAACPRLDPLLALAASGGEQIEDVAAAMLDAADALDHQIDRRTQYYLDLAQPWALMAVGVLVLLVLLVFWGPFYELVGHAV
jgi:general secretion pathway protein F